MKPITENTTTLPNGGINNPDDTLVANRTPAKIGPKAFPRLPPSIDNPFILALSDIGTVLLVVMVIVENTTEDETLIHA